MNIWWMEGLSPDSFSIANNVGDMPRSLAIAKEKEYTEVS